MAEFIQERRTHNCVELRAQDIGDTVILMGWVNSHRDHGGCVFVDLRDRYGLTQVKFDPEVSQEAHDNADTLRSEWVIGVKGKVISRGDNANDRLATGAIEVAAESLTIFNRSKTPRFQIRDGIDTGEDLRLKYRFLDLRRPELQNRIVARALLTRSVREALFEKGFLELETPILGRSTPEGARDYLVPSRVYPGTFYALPQSPQLFKQLYMISGYDRYYQICRCFRDEDLRSDRQPEFTQIDIELSFGDAEDVMEVAEHVAARAFKDHLDLDVGPQFPRMTYDEAMDRFGRDAPDTRFGFELKDVSEIFKGSGFKAFASVVDGGGMVKAINCDQATLSRRQLDELTGIVGNYGAKGLAWIKIHEDRWQGPIVKFLGEAEQAALIETLGLKPGDIAMFVADKPSVVHASLGNLRLHLARLLDRIPKDTYNFLWVTDFPAFEWDEDGQRWSAMHHPFTSPKPEDLELFATDPGKVRSFAYDLVLNGSEVAGGSVRIHDQAIQSRVFELLGIGKEEAENKFGFLLNALQYGAPPHAGIAFGFDRLMAILTNVDSIREVIAYPKTQKAACLMTSSPSAVDSAQLDELGLRIKVTETL